MLLQINHITKTYNVNSSFKRKKHTWQNNRRSFTTGQRGNHVETNSDSKSFST